MKKIILSVILFFALSTTFCQTFMHGAGITFMGNLNEGNFTYGGGFTYSPRVNFVETEKLSVSAGIPLSMAFSASTSGTYDSYYNTYNYDDITVGFVFNAPLIINLNMGRGSTNENREKFGYFVGAGFGYHHGDFLVDKTDANGNNYQGTFSLNTFGPAANAGVRFGVGKMHKNIELRFSYMKGLNDTQPDIFGIACLFNF